MKTKNTKIFVTAIGVLMGLMMLCVAFVTIAKTEDDVPNFVEGEVIYQPTLTGTGEKGVPEGWIAAPETRIAWPNNNGSGGWMPDEFNAKNMKNSKINPEPFTLTEDGLHVGMGQGDFSIILPELADSSGNAVEDYMYTMIFSRGADEVPGDSVGPITDIDGDTTYIDGDMDFLGGTYFKVYDYNGYRNFHYAGGRRFSDDNVTGGLTLNTDGKIKVTVYHCNNMNYYYVNDQYVCSKSSRNWSVDDATLNGIGIDFTSSTNMTIHEITVKKILAKGVSESLTLPGADIRYCDVDGGTSGAKAQGLRFAASIDKTSELYRTLIGGDYDITNENVKFGMVILPTDLVPLSGILTVDTPEALDIGMTKISSQDANSLNFMVTLLDIPEEQQTRAFSARMYVKTKTENGSWEYTYSKDTITRSYYGVANLFYKDHENTSIRKRLDRIFQNCNLYEGGNADEITFAMFSDFHYIEDVYMSSVADLNSIFDRAHAVDADLVMHGGDFSNDYYKSPEIVKAFLENKYNLPALGVYGNHETEGPGGVNTMKYVTPLLTNQKVVWGTEDGTMSADGSVSYYYYEIKGFRIIALDTNYFLMKDTNQWKHIPAGVANISDPSHIELGLGDAQMEWLEATLMDAAEKDIPCIVLSHVGFTGLYTSSGQYEEVRALFEKANAKQAGTVLMAISGHTHDNYVDMIDNILYFTVAATRNREWVNNSPAHYGEYTFERIKYDDDGNEIERSNKKLDDLGQGKNTWFSTDPLYAIVKVSSNGRIVIDGVESTWLHDIAPTSILPGQQPEITSGTFDVVLY